MTRIQYNRLVPLLIPQLFFWAVTFQWISQNNPRIELISQLLLILAVVSWMLLDKRRERIKLNRIFLPITLIMLLPIFSIQRSPLPIHGLDQSIRALGFLAIFSFFVFFIRTDNEQRIWENTLISLVTFFSLFNLFLVTTNVLDWLQFNNLHESSLPFKFRLPGSFLAHPNYDAGFINLLIPLMLVRLFQNTKNGYRLWIGTLLSINVTALFFTSSRGGWVSGFIGITISLLICCYIFASRRREAIAKIKSSFTPGMRAVLVGIAAIFVTAAVLAIVRLVGSTGRPSLWLSRERPWRIGWELFTNNMVFGNGPGSVHLLIASDPFTPPLQYLTHTHNLILQIGSELGIIGIGLLVWVSFVAFRDLVISFRNGKPSEKLHTAAVLGSLTSLMIHHLVDYIFEAPLYIVTVLFLIASLSRYNQSDQPLRSRSRVSSVAASCLIMVMLFLDFFPRGYFGIEKAIHEYKTTPSIEAANRICEFVQDYPKRSFTYFECSRALAGLENPSSRHVDLEKSIDIYISGLELDPYWPIHWANISALEWQIGEENNSLVHMKKALESAPYLSILNMNYGWMLEQSGQLEEAKTYYKRAVNWDPFLINSLFFIESEFDPYQEDLFDNLPAELIGTNSTTMAWYYFETNQLSLARTEFLKVIDHNPSHPLANAGLAFIESRSGNMDEAQFHIDVARHYQGSSPYISYILGTIALETELESEAMQQLERAFDLFKMQDVSGRFYRTVYHIDYITPITVPQLNTVFPTQQMFEDFQRLANYKIENHEIARGEYILEQLKEWTDF